MKTWQSIVIGVLVGFLLAGAIFFVAKRPEQKELQLIPPTQISSITIDVGGQVTNPGVYQLPAGSRVNDALLAAKGLLSEADTSEINLAAFLHDGDKIYVPSLSRDTTALSNSNETSMVDVNLATLEELDSLPGIGPQKAQAIIDYRESYGPFKQVEDLLYVSGIGQSIIDQIRDRVIFTQ